jgi:hypothetical protein
MKARDYAKIEEIKDGNSGHGKDRDSYNYDQLGEIYHYPGNNSRSTSSRPNLQFDLDFIIKLVVSHKVINYGASPDRQAVTVQDSGEAITC